MSIRRAQAEIDREELLTWIAYDRMHPIGPERLDFGLAQICTILAQIHAPKGKKYTTSDFMPFVKESRPRKTAQQIQDSLFLFAKMHNKGKG